MKATIETKVRAVESGKNVTREVWRWEDGTRELRVKDKDGSLIRWAMIADKVKHDATP